MNVAYKVFRILVPLHIYFFAIAFAADQPQSNKPAFEVPKKIYIHNITENI